MGRKDAAREIAVAAGVPVVPVVRRATATRRRFAFPVLVKAAAGGGGKGMRIVRAAGRATPRRSPRPRREARRAFGDDTMLVEKYVEHGRHIEVQVLADAPRQRRAPLRARLLDPAPPPEGARGGARRRRSPPRSARAVTEAAVALARRGRLRQRRHRGVPARQRHRRGLLPGDEHPAPGRAPGHRAGRSRRRSTWSSCSCGSPPASRCRSPRTTSRSTGTRSRPGSTPRTPSTASCRRPAPRRWCAGRRGARVDARARERAGASARRTTRCSARSSRTAPTARPPGGRWSPRSTTPRSSG